jgi:hypothetical protein
MHLCMVMDIITAGTTVLIIMDTVLVGIAGVGIQDGDGTQVGVITIGMA